MDGVSAKKQGLWFKWHIQAPGNPDQIELQGGTAVNHTNGPGVLLL